ncbi:bifunctional 4-hydroxy-2-oxoglutarate aldolase/2-dehydro-3-deoxy-phosphogluconate aldolase [Streptomyces sp. NPDC020681]|uniref:bifunctional 4-hydroxy-2-oxoglutarate aldolase/2-dehydro-3-deoxy-phosphogluconate aldolase n=1 Tax=Streptomyces sp. NPDC020681 TaxID=3365083 RepID=UPI0037A62480
MDLTAALRSRRLVAIVRGDNPQAALDTVLTLVDEDITLVEISLSGQDALDVIAEARAALGPDAPLGAGTVLTSGDARAVQRAGADFVVTPALCEGITTAKELGLPVLAGVMTPSEIVAGLRLGADALKLFPAAQAGGLEYLRALRGPFPEVRFVPVGGVDAGVARDCLAAGATAVGVGSPLIGDAAAGGSLEALRARARAFVKAVAETEGEPR